jgi:hypothetical protein
MWMSEAFAPESFRVELFTLAGAGPDERHGTADDVPVCFTTAWERGSTLLAVNSAAEFRVTLPEAGSYVLWIARADGDQSGGLLNVKPAAVP